MPRVRRLQRAGVTGEPKSLTRQRKREEKGNVGRKRWIQTHTQTYLRRRTFSKLHKNLPNVVAWVIKKVWTVAAARCPPVWPLIKLSSLSLGPGFVEDTTRFFFSLSGFIRLPPSFLIWLLMPSLFSYGLYLTLVATPPLQSSLSRTNVSTPPLRGQQGPSA